MAAILRMFWIKVAVVPITTIARTAENSLVGLVCLLGMYGFAELLEKASVKNES